MVKPDISSLLVTGIDVVPLAISARRAGYQVYAVDYFGDQDLRHLCKESLSIINQEEEKTCGRLDTDFNPEILLQLARTLLKREPIDAILLSSGLEDFPEVLSELNDLAPILGNSIKSIQEVRDKEKFFTELKRLGIPHPKTYVVKNILEAKEGAKDIGYPVVVKPAKGCGGVGIRRVQNPKDLENAFKEASKLDKEFLIQQFVPGIPASASIISTSKRALILTVNEQLIGMLELGQREPFGWCGNIVPLSLDKIIIDRYKMIVERTIRHFKLIGSNGVDLVISENGVPSVIEVNPRFQGTLECVERVLRINLVEGHIKACTRGVLPTVSRKISGFCARLILFTPYRSKMPDLSKFKGVRDVPMPGVIVEKGEPVCSIVLDGQDRNLVLDEGFKMIGLILKLLRPF